MITFINNEQPTRVYKILCAFIAIAFVFAVIVPPTPLYAQSPVLNLPAPGVMVAPSVGFSPPLVTGLTIYPEDPLKIDFIVDTGDDYLEGEPLEQEAQKMINYFFASLTVPEDEMWVNLSPYEKDRIVADGLSQTEMGRDMLAQDYLLKQLTASLMYPEEELGEKFWDKVYAKAQAKFGHTNIPTDTFNKIWIVPAEATVFVHENNVFVTDSHLNVMLEQDYLSLEANQNSTDHGIGDANVLPLSKETADVVREVLIPEIEREVNEGKNFAPLRQMFSSIILASWYKNKLKNSLLDAAYVDQNKVSGIDIEDKKIREKIYKQYVAAFEKGVFNYIREDIDKATRTMIPRKYFSGGVVAEVEVKESDSVGKFATRAEERLVIGKLTGSSPVSTFAVRGKPVDKSNKEIKLDKDPEITDISGVNISLVEARNDKFSVVMQDSDIKQIRDKIYDTMGSLTHHVFSVQEWQTYHKVKWQTSKHNLITRNAFEIKSTLGGLAMVAFIMGFQFPLAFVGIPLSIAAIFGVSAYHDYADSANIRYRNHFKMRFRAKQALMDTIDGLRAWSPSDYLNQQMYKSALNNRRSEVLIGLRNYLVRLMEDETVLPGALDEDVVQMVIDSGLSNTHERINNWREIVQMIDEAAPQAEASSSPVQKGDIANTTDRIVNLFKEDSEWSQHRAQRDLTRAAEWSLDGAIEFWKTDALDLTILGGSMVVTGIVLTAMSVPASWLAIPVVIAGVVGVLGFNRMQKKRGAHIANHLEWRKDAFDALSGVSTKITTDTSGEGVQSLIENVDALLDENNPQYEGALRPNVIKQAANAGYETTPQIVSQLRELDSRLDLFQAQAVSSPVEENPGGIDFNPSIMEVHETGGEVDLNFSNTQFTIAPDQINGIVPVIINVTPVTNLPFLLGMAGSEETRITKI